LKEWRKTVTRFVKVMPRDYKRVLAAEARARSEDREPEFEELVGVSHG
jgi:glutamate synthase (NADPH/NADH) large chain